MTKTFKDDETLVDIQRACGWSASVALLEITSEPDCMTKLRQLELAHAALESEEVAAASSSARVIKLPWLDAGLAAAVCFILLSILPGAAGGTQGMLVAAAVSIVVGGLSVRVNERPDASRP